MKIRTQADVEAAQQRDDELFAKRAQRALDALRVASRYYFAPDDCAYIRHAYRHRNDPDFMAALRRQANRPTETEVTA